MPKKVLLIEYEPRYIERIRTLLSPLGHALTETHDGEAGLQAFSGSKFDLVLLSGMLPRLPSAEVIREIRKKGGRDRSAHRSDDERLPGNQPEGGCPEGRGFRHPHAAVHGRRPDGVRARRPGRLRRRRQDHAHRHGAGRGGRVAADLRRYFFGRARRPLRGGCRPRRSGGPGRCGAGTRGRAGATRAARPGPRADVRRRHRCRKAPARHPLRPEPRIAAGSRTEGPAGRTASGGGAARRVRSSRPTPTSTG